MDMLEPSIFRITSGWIPVVTFIIKQLQGTTIVPILLLMDIGQLTHVTVRATQVGRLIRMIAEYGNFFEKSTVVISNDGFRKDGENPCSVSRSFAALCLFLPLSCWGVSSS